MTIYRYMVERDHPDTQASAQTTPCKPPVAKGERLIATLRDDNSVACEYHSIIAYGMAP